MAEIVENLRMATVLLVEDNPAERNLARRALQKGVMQCDLRVVSDGEEAMDYLWRRGPYAAAEQSPRPHLILLDLNMPKLDGRQVLEKIKSDPALQSIPVVVMTTSRHDEDIARNYQLGCNSFISKPVEVHEFLDALRQLGCYWLRLVVLPAEGGGIPRA